MADPLQESLKNKRFANRALLAAGVAGVILYVLYSPSAKRNQGELPKASSRNNIATSDKSGQNEDKTKLAVQSGKMKG